MASSRSKPTLLGSARRFIIGPWPIHVLAVWTLVSVMVLVVSYRLVGPPSPLVPQTGSLIVTLAGLVFFGIVGPGFVLLPLMAYQRYRGRFTQRPINSLEYLLSLLVASAIAAALVAIILRIFPTLESLIGVPGIPVSIGRFFFPVWFFNALLAAFLERIRVSSQIAQDALKVVTKQRRMLLDSDERVRGQVATYLHDRVQTDLVSIGLRLRAVIEQSPKEIQDELTASVADIERVRSQEVRRASRHLSPDISRIGLVTALRELADAYRPGMTVSIAIAESIIDRPTSESETTRATAVYRICEQGLLNAAVHGHASECSIIVSEAHDHQVVLELRDNGVGSPHTAPEPGTGMTVISAWVESLRGEWSLTNTGAGMLLTASLPSPKNSNQD